VSHFSGAHATATAAPMVRSHRFQSTMPDDGRIAHIIKHAEHQ